MEEKEEMLQQEKEAACYRLLKEEYMNRKGFTGLETVTTISNSQKKIELY